jgi:flagellar biosynthetic protein FlhB
MAEQEQDRSEEATPYKKDEAKKQGTVARSQDVVAAASIGALGLFILFSGAGVIRQCLQMFSFLFLHAADFAFSFDGACAWLEALAVALLVMFLPFFMLMLITSVLACVIQTGFVLSTEPLKPDWNRINPLEGVKRFFTVKILLETAKSCLKFVIYTTVLYYLVKNVVSDNLYLLIAGPLTQRTVFGNHLSQVLWCLFLAMIALAIIDVLITRRSLAKKLKMSKREVKEEHKRREGNPVIKARLREIRMQFLQKTRAVSRVKEADVLLVNPQHLALAIHYQRGKMPAPLLLAKGAGELALRMRQVAGKHGIPVMENKPLARALYQEVGINQSIPEQYFASVAKILVWAFRVRKSIAK